MEATQSFAITTTEIIETPADFITAEPASDNASHQPPDEIQPFSKKRKLSEEAAVVGDGSQTARQGSTAPSVNTTSTSAVASAAITAVSASIAIRPPTFLPTPDGLLYYTTSDVPMNRQGFRYIPAGPSPPGSIISHRTAESPPEGYVRVSWEDRSPYLRVTTDGRGVMGDKGFRSARLNVPVKEGKWYMEVRMHKAGGDGQGQGAHVRLGWARREAPLNGPAGMDGYSYAMRDKTGEKVTLSRPRPYGKPWTSGDVIGLYISLPPRRQARQDDPNDPARVLRKRIAINYKNQPYFESMDYAQSKEMISLMEYKQPSTAPSKKNATVKNVDQGGSGNSGAAGSRRRKSKPTVMPDAPQLRPLPTLPNSCIAFFVNGECQGPAFTDVYDYLQLRPSPKQKSRRGVPAYVKERENMFDDCSLGYYPFISVFNDARIEINAGPNFDYPPPPDIDTLLYSPNLASNSKPIIPPAKGQTPPTNPAAEAMAERALPQSNTQATWRPLCERYAQYFREEWEQDEKEEAEARKSHVAAEKIERSEKTRDGKRAKKKHHHHHRGSKHKKSGLSEVTNASSLASEDRTESLPETDANITNDGIVEVHQRHGTEGNKIFGEGMDTDLGVDENAVFGMQMHALHGPIAHPIGMRTGSVSPVDRRSRTPSSSIQALGTAAEEDVEESDGAEASEAGSESSSEESSEDDDQTNTDGPGVEDDEETESDEEDGGSNQPSRINPEDVEMEDSEGLDNPAPDAKTLPVFSVIPTTSEQLFS